MHDPVWIQIHQRRLAPDAQLSRYPSHLQPRVRQHLDALARRRVEVGGQRSAGAAVEGGQRAACRVGWGVGCVHGGAGMLNIKNPEVRERHAIALYGCAYSEAVAANSGRPLREHRSMSMLYLSQRGAAKTRGVPWEITFIEWCRIWCESGRLHLRGVGRGSYCMARHGDVGPYSVDNVSIRTTEANSSDGIRKAMKGGMSTVKRKSQVGTGRGWTIRKGRHYRNPYQVVVADKYVGCFATQSQAEAAYKQAAERHLQYLQRSQSAMSGSFLFLPQKSFANSSESFAVVRKECANAV